VELLLNILWLLLAGPGIYLWSRRRPTKPSFQLCIALACLLFLLFPVISASDDLHAMRSEMEESSPGKRVLEQIAKRSPRDTRQRRRNRGANPPTTLTKGKRRGLIGCRLAARDFYRQPVAAGDRESTICPVSSTPYVSPSPEG